MRLFPGMFALTALAVALPAMAEVVDATPSGFTIEHELLIAADRATVWDAAVNDIAQWWSDDHTVSGNSERLSLDPRPLGCFCESLAGTDGVVHMTVTSVSGGVLLRLTGGLGPLGLLGVNGNMTWEFFDDSVGTRVRFTYAVGGYRPGGLDAVADPVDAVIGEALDLLKAHVERG